MPQLIDATSGSHLWADRFDRDLADIFVVQDEVVGKIVNALSGTLPSARTAPKRRAIDMEAYDLFVRGRSLAMLSLEDARAARPLLERAIEIAPNFAEAHAWLAMSHQFGFLFCGEPEEHRDVQMPGWTDLSYDDGFDSIGHAQRSFWKGGIKVAGGYLRSPRWLLYKPYEMAELERRIYELQRGG